MRRTSQIQGLATLRRCPLALSRAPGRGLCSFSLFHFGRLLLNLFFNSLLFDLLLPVVVAFAAQALFHASCCASPGLVSCQLLRKPWPCFTPVVAQALALFHASCCASPGLVSLARCRGFAARALLLAAYALGVALRRSCFIAPTWQTDGLSHTRLDDEVRRLDDTLRRNSTLKRDV